MKGLFLVYGNIDDQTLGINKKIWAQINNFNRQGLECKPYVLNPGIRSGYKILYRMPFANMTPVWQYDKIYEGLDFLYFRRPFQMSVFMRKVLSQIKKNNPGIKIILELPTYPYDSEVKERIVNYPLYIKDKYNRKKLLGLVDKIATLTDDKKIWNIETLKIANGLDITKYPPKGYTVETGDIHLLAVAVFKLWHGYERIIQGLKNYYSTHSERKVYLHMVGDGDELTKYKKLVKEYNLEDSVIFYGFLQGEELAHIYDQCDIAISSLGMYKINLFTSSALKSREYLIKGMPIVSGVKIDIFEKNPNYKYYLEFPNDNSYINIEKIILFYDSIYKDNNKDEIIGSIRTFAEKNISIESAMKEVVDYIKDK